MPKQKDSIRYSRAFKDFIDGPTDRLDDGSRSCPKCGGELCDDEIRVCWNCQKKAKQEAVVRYQEKHPEALKLAQKVYRQKHPGEAVDRTIAWRRRKKQKKVNWLEARAAEVDLMALCNRCLRNLRDNVLSAQPEKERRKSEMNVSRTVKEKRSQNPLKVLRRGKNVRKSLA